VCVRGGNASTVFTESLPGWSKTFVNSWAFPTRATSSGLGAIPPHQETACPAPFRPRKNVPDVHGGEVEMLKIVPVTEPAPLGKKCSLAVPRAAPYFAQKMKVIFLEESEWGG
jgi:hypothetical protein